MEKIIENEVDNEVENEVEVSESVNEQEQAPESNTNARVNFGGVEKLFAPVISRNRRVTEKILTIILICIMLIPAINIFERLVNPAFISSLFSHQSPLLLPDGFLFKCYEFHVVYHPTALDTLHNFFGGVLIIFLAWYAFGALLRKSIEGKPSLTFGAFVKRYLWQCMFLLLAVFMIIASFAAADTDTAMSGDPYRKEGLFTWLRYIIIMFGAYLVRDSKNKRKILITMAVSSAFVCFIALGQYFRWWVSLNCGYGSYITGCFQNSNHLAYYLTMSILCTGGLLATTKKWYMGIVYGILLAVSVATLAYNNTLGGFLAVAVALIPCILLIKFGAKASIVRAALPVLVIVAVAVGLFVIPAGSKIHSNNIGAGFSSLFSDVEALMGSTSSTPITQGSDGSGATAGTPSTPQINGEVDQAAIERLGTNRVGLWKYALKFIGERPVFGYGPEQLGELYNATDLQNPSDRPHNEYLQYALFFGIPALILYMGAIVTIFVRQIKRLRKLQPETVIAACAVIGYMISALFGNTMFYTTPFFFLLLGLAASPCPVTAVVAAPMVVGKAEELSDEAVAAESTDSTESTESEATTEESSVDD